MLEGLQDPLSRHFGHALRPFQEQAVRAVFEKQRALVVVATGSGKSICYQLPAVALAPRCALVVSPLIALMEDQVESLRAKGVSPWLLL